MSKSLRNEKSSCQFSYNGILSNPTKSQGVYRYLHFFSPFYECYSSFFPWLIILNISSIINWYLFLRLKTNDSYRKSMNLDASSVSFLVKSFSEMNSYQTSQKKKVLLLIFNRVFMYCVRQKLRISMEVQIISKQED